MADPVDRAPDFVRRLAEQADQLAQDRVERNARIRELEVEAERLREAGDRMATAIEKRWSGPGGCDCAVCQTAKDWRGLP